MEVAAEDDDALASRRTARETHRGARCFGTAVHEAHLLATGDTRRDRLGQLHLTWCRRTERRSVGCRRAQRRGDGRMGMTEDDRAVALDEVDVPVALDVPHVGAFRACDDVRRSTDCLERADRTVDSTGNRARRTFVELCVRADTRTRAQRRHATRGATRGFVAKRNRCGRHGSCPLGRVTAPTRRTNGPDR